MRRGNGWDDDDAFCAIARAAWPRDWGIAHRNASAPGQVAARGRLARRYEGFRAADALAHRAEVIRAQCAAVEVNLQRLREALDACGKGSE